MINWFCHMYPYGNLHELNLDWVIDTVKQGEKEIADFIGVNTIKYANPILWNITSQYEANTVVVDGQTGNAYISVKAVPSGVHLNRTEYWTQIYNYANVVDTLREQIAYNEGESTTATRPYLVDDLVFVNGVLYRVIAPMIAGDSFVANSNVVKTTINEEIARLHGFITDEASARESADDTLQANIEAEASARQSADAALQSADATLQTNIDNEVNARESADDTLQANIEAEASARQSADATLQTNIDNEVNARESADNILAQSIANIDSMGHDTFNGKRVLIIGDSTSDNDTQPPNWTTYFTNKVTSLGGTVTNIAENGSSFIGWYNDGLNLITEADVYIVMLGVNDFQGQFTFDNLLTPTMGVFNKICEMSASGALMYYISPLPCYTLGVNDFLTPLNAYRDFFEQIATSYGFNIISGLMSPLSIANHYSEYYQGGVHPTPTISPVISEYIYNSIICRANSGSKFIPVSIARTIETGSGTISISYIAENMIIISINASGLTQYTWNNLIDCPPAITSQYTSYVESDRNAYAQIRKDSTTGKLQIYPNDTTISLNVLCSTSITSNPM